VSDSVFSSWAGRDTAVDLGTANTIVYVRSRGIVLEEPSLVAVGTHDGRPVAVGSEAKRMLGRTPAQIEVVAPVQHGVIADLEVCERMLRYFVEQIHQRRWARPRMLICVPAGITGVEQRAVQEAAESAGARRPVQLIEGPMAAAIGLGLPVHEATGSMVVVIGAGCTEVAVISLGGIVASESVRIGGAQIDEAIVAWVKKEHSLALGERTAEDIKLVMGTAYPPPGARGSADDAANDEFEAEISGRDLVTGLPRTVVTTTSEIREAIDEPVSAFVDAVKSTLDRTPPDLAADIMQHGIALTGGGALLRGLDQRLADETGMPITIAGNPLQAVVKGAGHCLEHLDACREVFVGAGQA
jgi:rod shape-determining protein MreB and related proteins